MKSLKINLGIFICLSVLLVCTSSCDKVCTEGMGTITTETLSVSDFTAIDLSIASGVSIQQSSTFLVEATGHPNIIEDIKTTVNNGTWVIELEDECYRNFELNFVISMPILNGIGVSGSGDVEYGAFDGSEELSIDISGSGRVSSNASHSDVKNMDVAISGSGSFTGNTDYPALETLDIDISGSGSCNAFPISVNDCTVNVSGSGEAFVTVNNNLEVSISGSGSVSYKGNPNITSDISGSGELIDAN